MLPEGVVEEEEGGRESKMELGKFVGFCCWGRGGCRTLLVVVVVWLGVFVSLPRKGWERLVGWLELVTTKEI